MTVKLTPEDLANGWTPETLAKYQAERERAGGRVPGNVVTAYERQPPPRALLTSKHYNPITRRLNT